MNSRKIPARGSLAASAASAPFLLARNSAVKGPSRQKSNDDDDSNNDNGLDHFFLLSDAQAE
jgi:hypothetical protein